jgi:hypothetical protein
MKKQYLMAALAAGGLTLGTNLKAADPSGAAPAPPLPGQAQPPAQPSPPGQLQPGQNPQKPRRAELAPEHSCLGATHILGREVRNDVGERLGIVQDLIVNLDSEMARFAIIKSGGTLGIGGTRVAVPLADLKWSADSKEFIMAATKEEIQSASTAPTGGWAFAANQEWAERVDRFYGDPGKLEISDLARPSSTGAGDNGEFVRDVAHPEPAIGPQDQLPSAGLGAKMPASALADGELLVRVNQVIAQYAGPAAGGDVQATVEKGVVTLKGKVATGTQKQDLETRIKGLDGVVTLIDDQLVATNE